MKKFIHSPFLLSTLALGLLVSLFQNCSSAVQFGDLDSKNFSSETHEGEGDWLRTVQTFTTTVTSDIEQELDILWVVDNSKSMREEAEHVQKNLDHFVEHLSQSADVKLALISASRFQSHQGVDLSSQAKAAGMLQIYKEVGSHSALTDILNNQHHLLSYFRPNAAKAFVIVSDDNSHTNTHEFLRRLHPDLSSHMKMYGFIAFNKFISPCQAQRGSVYEQLSTATGGAVYNICDRDWSDHFGDLSNQVGSQIGNNKFKLKKNPEVVEYVKLNGLTLAPHQYSIAGNTLTVDASLLQEVKTHQVEVRYTHR